MHLPDITVPVRIKMSKCWLQIKSLYLDYLKDQVTTAEVEGNDEALVDREMHLKLAHADQPIGSDLVDFILSEPDLLVICDQYVDGTVEIWSAELSYVDGDE